MTNLKEPLQSFVDHVAAQINGRRGADATKSPGESGIRPLTSAARFWFEAAEATAPWDDLVKACSETFHPEGHSKSLSSWRHALGTWFRRSGTYTNCLTGTVIDSNALSERLAADIISPDEMVTQLGLLEGVRFARPLMEFDGFSVVKPVEVIACG
jgi:hypothetical protein